MRFLITAGRGVFVLALAALAITGCAKENQASSPSSGSQTQGAEVPVGVDPSIVFEQLVQAVNSGNVPEATALFTDDATWEGPRQCEQSACKGKAAVQRNIETLVSGKANWIRGGGQSQGNFVALAVMDLSQQGDGGTPGKLYACTMELQNGRIKSLHFKAGSF